MIGINFNNKDYIIIIGKNLSSFLYQYQAHVTGLKMIEKDNKCYAIIYGDDVKLRRNVDFYYRMDIHPSEYRDFDKSLNVYQIEMSQEILTVNVIDDSNHVSESFKGLPKEVLNHFNKSDYDDAEFEVRGDSYDLKELINFLDVQGANI